MGFEPNTQYNGVVKGLGERLSWMLAQVVAYSGLLIWIFERNRRWGFTPEPLDFLVGMGLVALIATFALLGAKVPFAKTASSKKPIELPVDPISICFTFLILVLLALYEFMHNDSFATPQACLLVAGTAILATVFRERPGRKMRTLVSLFLVAGVLMFASYEYEAQSPPHSPGVAYSDMFFGGVWIFLPCALGIWTAVHEATSSKMALLGLIVVTLSSMAAIYVLTGYFNLFGYWICMLIPILVAGLHLLNYLESRSEIPEGADQPAV